MHAAAKKEAFSSAEKVADEMLRNHGRSFYWARHLLGRETARRSTLLYSFCRFIDDIADGDLPGGVDLLRTIRSQVKTGDPGKASEFIPQVQIFLALSREVGVPVTAALDLIDGLIFDQGTVAIDDQDQLIVYAYQVAGTVGLMMAPILGCLDRRANVFAVDLGIGMQLTNIARDVAEDAQLGRRYLPAVWCNNISAQEITGNIEGFDPDSRHEISKAVLKTLDLAEVYYHSGISGLRYLPLQSNLAIGVAAFVYRAIGRSLVKKGGVWWRGREVVGPGGKLTASIRSLHRLTSLSRPDHSHDERLHAPLRSLERQDDKR